MIPLIKIFGQYNDIKNALFALPTSKIGKYVYFIFFSNFKLKIGVTGNMKNRIMAHENNLRAYGSAKIRTIFVTRLTDDYKLIEKEVIEVLESIYKRCGSEFFSATNPLKVLMETLSIFNKYLFYELNESNSSYIKFFIASANEYFLKNPTCSEWELDVLKLHYNEVKISYKKIRRDLLENYPDCISKGKSGLIKVKRSFLHQEPKLLKEERS